MEEMMKNKKIVYILFILLFNTALFSKTLFTYHENGEVHEDGTSYVYQLLKLSLEKTKDKYGDYEIIKSPKMNKKRAILTLKSNSIKNFIVKISTTKEFMKEFAYADFPIDRGVVGYRVAFISPKLEENIKEYDTLEKIKKLKVVQGRGWLDNDVLKYNGFNVYVANNKKSAFNMLSLNRADLFLRGINEVLDEYNFLEDAKKLAFDKTFMLYYPLPRFFYMHKSNKKVMKRVEEGIYLAYKDGSLDKLFNKYYKDNIDFLNIKDRKIYKIENPFLKGVDNTYEKYIYDPFK
jgi:hypothetical protein